MGVFYCSVVTLEECSSIKGVSLVAEVLDMERSSCVCCSSNKFVIFISICLVVHFQNGQSIDWARKTYRNSKEILLILEEIVTAAESTTEWW